MHEILSSFSFWFYSVLWFGGLMFITPPFEDWNWKQAIFIGVISGPIGWVLTTIVGIISGIVFLWELLGKEDKKK